MSEKSWPNYIVTYYKMGQDFMENIVYRYSVKTERKITILSVAHRPWLKYEEKKSKRMLNENNLTLINTTHISRINIRNKYFLFIYAIMYL